MTRGNGLAVSFRVTNTGKRAGTEIAEVYAALPEAAHEPPKRLIGWTRVELAPGESKQVSIPVDDERLTIYDDAGTKAMVLPGSYTILAGPSSRDLPLKQVVTVQ